MTSGHYHYISDDGGVVCSIKNCQFGVAHGVVFTSGILESKKDMQNSIDRALEQLDGLTRRLKELKTVADEMGESLAPKCATVFTSWNGEDHPCVLQQKHSGVHKDKLGMWWIRD